MYLYKGFKKYLRDILMMQMRSSQGKRNKEKKNRILEIMKKTSCNAKKWYRI